MVNKLAKFEKTFPFYKMDVNGFILKLNHAITMSCSGKDIHDNCKTIDDSKGLWPLRLLGQALRSINGTPTLLRYVAEPCIMTANLIV